MSALKLEIVRVLRKCGVSVTEVVDEVGRRPALLCGWQDENILLEVVDGPETEAERKWRQRWKGFIFIATDLQTAVNVVCGIHHAERCGVPGFNPDSKCAGLRGPSPR